MATKSATKKTVAKPAKAVAPKKKCDCKCDGCKCDGKLVSSQLSFYILIAILVAVTTLLVVSFSFNKSVRELFRPDSYVYNGKFAEEKVGKQKDSNNITILSAGAVIDLVKSNEEAFLIVGATNDEGSCITCDAFAQRVAKYAGVASNIYRYNYGNNATTKDDERAKNALGGCDESPAFFFIKDGVVYDRLDDVKEEEDLKLFISKYASASTEL